jgi:hypothetical protein
MADPKTLARQIPPLLGKLHQSAGKLRNALAQLQKSPKPLQHYLLQPAFAEDSARQLEGSFDKPFALAAALYAQLDHSDPANAGDARTTLQIPGLLCVPNAIIQLAQETNAYKAAFFQAVTDYKNSLSEDPAPERDRKLRELLSSSGYPRAHLRQCYRQILICPLQPAALALSWIKARKSIRKVSVDWCEKKLVQLDPQGADPGIQFQRQLLAGLHKNQHGDLRQVQIQSRPNLQVSEIFRDKNGETYRQVGYAAMPVLVVDKGDGRLPEFTRVDHQPANIQRRQRRDLAISREPLLPALRVHLRSGN